MFDKEYSFRGRHAEIVVELTANIGDSAQQKLFQRNIDVYMVAPLLGFMYGRKVALDESSQKTTKIFQEQLLREQSTLKYVYQLIALLKSASELSLEKRLDAAFRNFGSGKTESDENDFEAYVRGGVEILGEKLLEHANLTTDYVQKAFDFSEEIGQRYFQEKGADTDSEIVKLAKA